MEFVRIVDVGRNFDPYEKRIVSEAFAFTRKQSKLSCFDEECALKKGRTACEHIRHFYPDIGKEPAVFFRFHAAELPAELTCSQETEREDECHYNVYPLNPEASRSNIKRTSRRFFAEHCQRVFLCSDGADEPASGEQLLRLHSARKTRA